MSRKNLVFQSAVAAAERKIRLYPSSQHKLRVLQGLVVEQPVQLCPLCRGVAVFVLDCDAVNGKGGTILEPGFHPVGVQLKRQESSLFMVNLISISNGVCSDVLNPAIEPVVDLSIGLCFTRLHIFAHFLHT